MARSRLGRMHPAIPIALIVAEAYLLGSIPFGLIVSKTRGIDIRQHGSGNIGATNVWRVLGKKWGVLTFLCDTAKGALAVVIGFWIAGRLGGFQDPGYAGVTAALGCIIGHSF